MRCLIATSFDSPNVGRGVVELWTCYVHLAADGGTIQTSQAGRCLLSDGQASASFTKE